MSSTNANSIYPQKLAPWEYDLFSAHNSPQPRTICFVRDLFNLQGTTPFHNCPPTVYSTFLLLQGTVAF